MAIAQTWRTTTIHAPTSSPRTIATTLTFAACLLFVGTCFGVTPSASPSASSSSSSSHRRIVRVRDSPTSCLTPGVTRCHGWSSWGTHTNISTEMFSCSTDVPTVPQVFAGGTAASSWPTHYLYCNVVADGYAAGAKAQTVFGQLVPQLMIGNVEVCGGVNHSAQGPGTHRAASNWLAQAQYYFTDVNTGKAKCVGGAIVSVIPGQRVAISIKFDEHSHAVLSVGVVGGTSSTLVVDYPQLDPTLSWEPFVRAGLLRPYASFEAWDAPVTNSSMYPAGPWRVSVDAPTSSAVSWGAWKPVSTAMSVTTNGSRAATWLYSEQPDYK